MWPFKKTAVDASIDWINQHPAAAGCMLVGSAVGVAVLAGAASRLFDKYEFEQEQAEKTERESARRALKSQVELVSSRADEIYNVSNKTAAAVGLVSSNVSKIDRDLDTVAGSVADISQDIKTVAAGVINNGSGIARLTVDLERRDAARAAAAKQAEEKARVEEALQAERTRSAAKAQVAKVDAKSKAKPAPKMGQATRVPVDPAALAAIRALPKPAPAPGR